MGVEISKKRMIKLLLKMSIDAVSGLIRLCTKRNALLFVATAVVSALFYVLYRTIKSTIETVNKSLITIKRDRLESSETIRKLRAEVQALKHYNSELADPARVQQIVEENVEVLEKFLGILNNLMEFFSQLENPSAVSHVSSEKFNNQFGEDKTSADSSQGEMRPNRSDSLSSDDSGPSEDIGTSARP